MAVSCQGKTQLLDFAYTWDSFLDNVKERFKLPQAANLTVTTTAGEVQLTSVEELHAQTEVSVVLQSDRTALEPSQDVAKASASAELDAAVEQWLTKSKFTSYKGKLLAAGVTTMAALSALKSSDVANMGFTPIMARKFLQMLPSGSASPRGSGTSVRRTARSSATR